MVHQMRGDILYAWAATEINAHKRTFSFSHMSRSQTDDKPRAISNLFEYCRGAEEKGEANCLDYAMARKRRRKSNGWFRGIDNHTACISYQGSSLLQMRVWSQIAPLLKIFLQKEWVSQILLLPLHCLSGLIRILICNTEIGEKSDMAKSWATFCCSGTYK